MYLRSSSALQRSIRPKENDQMSHWPHQIFFLKFQLGFNLTLLFLLSPREILLCALMFSLFESKSSFLRFLEQHPLIKLSSRRFWGTSNGSKNSFSENCLNHLLSKHVYFYVFNSWISFLGCRKLEKKNKKRVAAREIHRRMLLIDF